MYEDDDILGKFEIKCSCVNLKIKIWKWWKNKKKQRNTNKKPNRRGKRGKQYCGI